MKNISSRDKFIRDNLKHFKEYYMIITNQKTGKVSYRIMSNLYCDPYYFIDIDNDYTKCFYISVNAREFYSKFKRHNMILENIDSSLGCDRVIYKRLI